MNYGFGSFVLNKWVNWTWPGTTAKPEKELSCVGATMRRRSSRMSEQKAIVGDQYGNSQRQVQPLRSKTDERKGEVWFCAWAVAVTLGAWAWYRVVNFI